MRNYDKPTLIIAIVLALFFWIYLRVGQEIPEAWRTLRDVRVELSGKSAELAYVIAKNNPVEITIKGPAELVNYVSRDEIVARIDVSQITRPGTSQQRPEIQLPRGVQISGKIPTLTVVTTALERKVFQVTVGFLALPPPGTAVGEYLVQPATVTVQGTPDVLERVRYVTVPIDPAEPLTVEDEFAPRAVDSRGERVEDASVLTASVKVRMASLTGQQVTREVAVRLPKLMNMPRNYTVTAVKVRPDVVTLSGETAILDRQPAYLETEPIDVGGIRKDATRTVRLRVPPGLTIVEGPEVRVDLEVQPIEP